MRIRKLLLSGAISSLLLCLGLFVAGKDARATNCGPGCGGTLSLFPAGLETDDVVEFAPVVTNTTATADLVGTPVAARLRCDRVDFPASAADLDADFACCLRLACPFGSSVSGCFDNNSLAPTFGAPTVHLDPFGSGALLDDFTVSADGNTICVEGMVDFTPGETLVLFSVMAAATTPVSENGGAFASAFNAPGAMFTNVTISGGTCDEPPPNGTASGQCGVSAPALYPPRCEIDIDKQVSCDGGVTWFDDDPAGAEGDNLFVTMNEDGTNLPCVGDLIDVRYRVRNTGVLDVSGCQLIDSNGNIPAVAFPNGGLISMGMQTDFFGPPTLNCTDVAAGEPNTATAVNCECLVGALPAPVNLGVDPFDTANFQCMDVPIPTLSNWGLVLFGGLLIATLYGLGHRVTRSA